MKNAAAPAIIERVSTAAKILPSEEIVSHRVAKATEGAAPKVRRSSSVLRCR